MNSRIITMASSFLSKRFKEKSRKWWKLWSSYCPRPSPAGGCQHPARNLKIKWSTGQIKLTLQQWQGRYGVKVWSFRLVFSNYLQYYFSWTCWGYSSAVRDHQQCWPRYQYFAWLEMICHTTSLWPADIKATCVVTDFLQSFRQFDLSLYLGPQLLHPPEVLYHLSPHDLYDGGGEGQAQEDVDSADHHVQTFVCNSFSKLELSHFDQSDF